MTIFQKQINDDLVEYILDNGWMSISVLNYGAVITRIKVPDKNGDKFNCVLNYADYSNYYENPLFLGAVIGPVAGRIAAGTFELDGTSYQLEKNEGDNHLHGGFSGYHKQFYQVETAINEQEDQLILYLINHQTKGYPGKIDFSVTYSLDCNNSFKILYQAKANAKTIFNPTNHTYFNLNPRTESVKNHSLKINAEKVQEIKQGTLPTGHLLNLTVEGNQRLQLQGGRLEETFNDEHEQLTLGSQGIDLAYLINTDSPEGAILENEETGIMIKLTTSEESIVVYTGNKLPNQTFLAENGWLSKHSGVTLETQNLPDAIHQADPKIILEPNKTYSSKTVFEFLNTNK